MGFYIVENSFSNYNQTYLSVPSSMNTSYSKDLSPDSLTNENFINLYKNSQVYNLVKANGYTYINNFNLFSTKLKPWADINSGCVGTNKFTTELIRTTFLVEMGSLTEKERSDKSSESLCVFEKVTGFDYIENPKFVFTHNIVPHPLTFLGENGEDVQDVNLSLTAKDRWLT